jgi:DNA-binding PadR family transcriptional regulator
MGQDADAPHRISPDWLVQECATVLHIVEICLQRFKQPLLQSSEDGFAPFWQFMCLQMSALAYILRQVLANIVGQPMSPKELLILRLLMDNPKGLYGSEFVHLSDGKISRGTVYTLLERMVDKKFVREVEEEPSTELQLRRTRHFITGVGQKACRDFAEQHGLDIRHGAFAR